jgi:hypothetical protein
MVSDNMNLNDSSDSSDDGEWFRTTDRFTHSFKCEFNGASMTYGHVYTVCIYHDNMS